MALGSHLSPTLPTAWFRVGGGNPSEHQSCAVTSPQNCPAVPYPGTEVSVLIPGLRLEEIFYAQPGPQMVTISKSAGKTFTETACAGLMKLCRNAWTVPFD